jgi:anti-anti-sigma factor
MLSVAVHDFGELTIVVCAGRVVRGLGIAKLETVVTSLRSKRAIVLDLAEAASIDAGGVGLLVSLRQRAGRNGVQLKLMNPSEPVQEVLELAALASKFDIYTCEEMAAFLGFGPSSASASLGESKVAS